MPYFIPTGKKSRTSSLWSIYRHVDLLPPTLQKRCNLKIGCGFGRGMQACDFCCLSPGRSVNPAGRGALLTFGHPFQLLPHLLCLGGGCSGTHWGRGSGQNCGARNGEAELGNPKAFLLFVEGGGMYSTAAYAFFLLCHWSIPENEGQMGRRDGAVSTYVPPSRLVCWCISQFVMEHLYENGVSAAAARLRHGLGIGIFYQIRGS